MNRRSIEALIKSGAFGSTGHSRKGMLDVLEQAQAAGSKVQQDALLGQASIFDFGGEDSAQTVTKSRPPVPAEEFDHGELLEIEKEALGLFVSEHPLKRVRGALRAAVDTSIAALSDHKDGAWITVGGIITQARKIRTRSGSNMMFATIDDLEADVEIVVFSRQLESFEALLQPDQLVIVRGKLEHKDGGKVSLVAQDVQPFAPSEEEIEAAAEMAVVQEVRRASHMTLQIQLGQFTRTGLDDLRDLLRITLASPAWWWSSSTTTTPAAWCGASSSATRTACGAHQRLRSRWKRPFRASASRSPRPPQRSRAARARCARVP